MPTANLKSVNLPRVNDKVMDLYTGTLVTNPQPLRTLTFHEAAVSKYGSECSSVSLQLFV
jgi:hypothetical protein